MKRDWDLIRKILLKLEEKADNTSFLENDVFDGVSPIISIIIINCLSRLA